MKPFALFPLILLTSLTLVSCSTKPVLTEYFKEKDITTFTSRVLKSSYRGKEIEVSVVKECSGKVICEEQELSLKVVHSDRFSFLKGKDLDVQTENRKINLNQRDYSNQYDMKTIAKDGTTGVLKEQFLIWVQEPDFREIAYAKTADMKIGEYRFVLDAEDRDSWQILLEKERLLQTMDDEQKREYGEYPHLKKEEKKQNVRTKRMVSEAEESTWKLVKDSDNPDDLKYFLEQFPESPYAIPAKLKLKQLERK